MTTGFLEARLGMHHRVDNELTMVCTKSVAFEYDICMPLRYGLKSIAICHVSLHLPSSGLTLMLIIYDEFTY